MALLRRLTLKVGDQILRQQRGRGLTTKPDITNKTKKDTNLLWDSDFLNENLKEGVYYFVWITSKQAYMTIFFINGMAMIEI